mmetsp:Transcript_111782/g.315722  ORF Transcript_111782/g.315722 Transcript_111782/m.315722 type:complete len:450 (+) Transcript_111782:116-1465(+)
MAVANFRASAQAVVYSFEGSVADVPFAAASPSALNRPSLTQEELSLLASVGLKSIIFRQHSGNNCTAMLTTATCPRAPRAAPPPPLQPLPFSASSSSSSSSSPSSAPPAVSSASSSSSSWSHPSTGTAGCSDETAPRIIARCWGSKSERPPCPAARSRRWRSRDSKKTTCGILARPKAQAELAASCALKVTSLPAASSPIRWNSCLWKTPAVAKAHSVFAISWLSALCAQCSRRLATDLKKLRCLTLDVANAQTSVLKLTTVKSSGRSIASDAAAWKRSSDAFPFSPSFEKAQIRLATSKFLNIFKFGVQRFATSMNKAGSGIRNVACAQHTQVAPMGTPWACLLSPDPIQLSDWRSASRTQTCRFENMGFAFTSPMDSGPNVLQSFATLCMAVDRFTSFILCRLLLTSARKSARDLCPRDTASDAFIILRLSSTCSRLLGAPSCLPPV